ncbi:MAG: glutaredoxin family protein [Mailhella sp.]|nr:glutaredoxin family protein [Mailhella sp.]
MDITLYTAPDCIRCKIVKAFLNERGIAYDTIDFKAQAEEFNTFYRTNRPKIYRNPEGVEFPLFYNGEVIRQGSGEVIAYMLSGDALKNSGAVTRSDLLHGWISGLYLSCCPKDQEENFLTLVKHLADGGLTVCMQTDGRNSALLEKVLALNVIAKLQLNILGDSSVYESLYGQAMDIADLAKTIELTRGFANSEIRYLASPLNIGGVVSWPDRAMALGSGKMVFEACGDHQLPIAVDKVTAEMPQGLQGLKPVEDALMLKYRSALREYLFKAEIA